MSPFRKAGFYADLKQKQGPRQTALFLSRRARRKGLNRSLEIFIPKPTLGQLSRKAKEFRHTQSITSGPKMKAAAIAPSHRKASAGGPVRRSCLRRKASGVFVDFWLDQNQMLFSRRYDELDYG